MKARKIFDPLCLLLILLAVSLPPIARAEDEKPKPEAVQTEQAKPAQVPGENRENQEEPKGPPKVVETFPKIGDPDVDSGILAILVTFDRDMSDGISWTGGGDYYPKLTEGKKPEWQDKRTCAYPVDLEKGRFYCIGVNSTTRRNFQSLKGVPAEPTVIYFTTEGATEGVKQKLQKPTVKLMLPQNHSSSADPKAKQMRIDFDIAMQPNIQLIESGPYFPPLDRTRRPYWAADHKSFYIPVQLKPKQSYRLYLNGRGSLNFVSESGVPLDSLLYMFQTGP